MQQLQRPCTSQPAVLPFELGGLVKCSLARARMMMEQGRPPRTAKVTCTSCGRLSGGANTERCVCGNSQTQAVHLGRKGPGMQRWLLSWDLSIITAERRAGAWLSCTCQIAFTEDVLVNGMSIPLGDAWVHWHQSQPLPFPRQSSDYTAALDAEMSTLAAVFVAPIRVVRYQITLKLIVRQREFAGGRQLDGDDSCGGRKRRSARAGSCLLEVSKR
jgi:hypothetical protein